MCVYAYMHRSTHVLVTFLYDRVLGRKQFKEEFILAGGLGDVVHRGRQSMGVSLFCAMLLHLGVSKSRALQPRVELSLQ